MNFNNVQEFNQSPYTNTTEEVVSGGNKRNKLAPLEMKSGNKRAAASAAHDRMPIDNDKNQRRGHHQQTNQMNIEDNTA
jgi:hypothetical protein